MSKNYNHILFGLFSLAIFVCLMSSSYYNSNAYSEKHNNSTNIDNPRAYVKNSFKYLSNDNNTVIVGGSVAKSDSQNFPQNVSVGLLTINNFTGEEEILVERPYNSILYENNEPFPFKFMINSTLYPDVINSAPFIYKSENVTLPYTKINTINLNYPVLPQGPNKELYGNITNTGLVQLNNITLFAIVNDKNSSQIDSVRTLIPVLKPNETRQFTFVPDPAIKDMVYFYSCVGGDIGDMKIDDYSIVNITTSKVLGYKFSSLIQIDSMSYNITTDKFDFTINNIYPYPGALSLEVMPVQMVPIQAYIDGNPVEDVKMRNISEKTLLDLAIPQGVHDISLSNLNK